MTETPETIYLIPGEDVDGAPAMVWCDDPAPGEGMKPEDTVKYVRAGSASAIERDALILRKQAEAVEQAANYAVGLGDQRTLLHYAQCLYQQADELERNQ